MAETRCRARKRTVLLLNLRNDGSILSWPSRTSGGIRCSTFEPLGRPDGGMRKKDVMLHRVVVSAVNGMTDYLECERKRVPEEVVLKAQRLESMVFAGYDSYSEGHEPPGL